MNYALSPLKFDHLDVNVQEAFEAYLDERGIGASLAAFIPDFAEWKEQQVSRIVNYPCPTGLQVNVAPGIHQVAL